ncbi:hypothetical protein CMI47_12695 [Candidatus Pacearchaeota archaeon]|nr:hypothetical protein [Candidatus Pacearchaeota archaeon]|tara:strand:+ start:151 stop:831 length:681 start_codon:yes stop_codon:yes gene_type:complete
MNVSLSLIELKTIVSEEVNKIIDEAQEKKYTKRELARHLLGDRTVRQFVDEFGGSIATVSRRMQAITLPMLKRQRGEEPTPKELAKAEAAAKELNLKQISDVGQSAAETADELHDVFIKIATEIAGHPDLSPEYKQKSAEELAIDPEWQNNIIKFAKMYYETREEKGIEVDFLHKQMLDHLASIEDLMTRFPADYTSRPEYGKLMFNLKTATRELGQRLGKDVEGL